MFLSSSGESFSEFVQAWDETHLSDTKKNQIAVMLEGQNLVFFFKYKGEIFGAQEPHRVVFARMKNPDSETSQGWLEEANFMAVNLTKAVQGQSSQHVFKHRDLGNIQVLPDKERVFVELLKQALYSPPSALHTALQNAFRHNRDQ